MKGRDRRNETKVQVSTKFRRDTGATGKRTFNLVIKSVMMSMMLVGSFVGGYIQQTQTESQASALETQSIEYKYQDEQALLLNLKNANKVLEAELGDGSLHPVHYTKLTQALIAIDVKLEMDGLLIETQSLSEILLKTETLLKQDISQYNDVVKDGQKRANDSMTALRVRLEGLEGTTIRDEGTPASSSQELLDASKVSANVPAPLAPEKYNDFVANSWWSEDFKWGIGRGIISGYINAKHPSQPSKGWGNWIDPTGDLTEYQMLSVMLRYIDIQAIADKNVKYIENRKKNIAYAEYVMASEYGITTRGTKDNANFANVQVTRGQMAQAIVSMHYGKAVSLNDAIKFMYDNALTSGKDSSQGKTIANFGANDRLERNQIISFLHRYDKMMSGSSVKDTLGLGSPSPKILEKFPNQKPIEQKPSPINSGGAVGKIGTTKADMVGKTFEDVEQYLRKSISEVKKPSVLADKKYTSKNGIKTVHPNATYNVNNQSEYDAVIAEVNKRVASMDLSNVSHKMDSMNTLYLEYMVKGLTGEVKPINDRNDPNGRSTQNAAVRGALSDYGVAYDLGVSLETLMDFRVASFYVSSLVLETSNVNGPPETAYDYFIKNEVDCTSLAYAYSIVFASLGYQTSVIHSPNTYHAFGIILLDGQWFSFESGVLKPYNKDVAYRNDYITEIPVQGYDKLKFVDVR